MNENPGCIGRLMGCGCSMVIAVIVLLVTMFGSATAIFLDEGTGGPEAQPPANVAPAPAPPPERKKKRRKKGRD